MESGSAILTSESPGFIDIQVPEVAQWADKKAVSSSTNFFAEALADLGTKIIVTDALPAIQATWVNQYAYSNQQILTAKNINQNIDRITEEDHTPVDDIWLMQDEIIQKGLSIKRWDSFINLFDMLVEKGPINLWYHLFNAPEKLEHYNDLYEKDNAELLSLRNEYSDFIRKIMILTEDHISRRRYNNKEQHI